MMERLVDAGVVRGTRVVDLLIACGRDAFWSYQKGLELIVQGASGSALEIENRDCG